MKERGISVQEAFDHVGELFRTWFDKYETTKHNLQPLYKSNKTVERYIAGMEDWVVGHIHCSFDCARYFGSKRQEVKQSLVVHFTPRVDEGL